ncbi:26100_t:CDS:2, partial [Gigaspora margarita]
SAASWIPFPYELRTNYRMFYDSYLDLNLDLAINFFGNIVNTVKNMIASDQFELSMYENVREETLILLYVNTFEKFLHMFESEIRISNYIDDIDTIIKDIANKLPDLKNIEKNLSKLNVLKNVLKFIEKSDQDIQRILNETEILRKEKNLYLRYIIQ